MVNFNHATKEMTVKIVYYGCGLCGKTTNLQTIWGRLPEKDKTKLVSLNTETDRTLFFDMMGIKVGNVAGFKTKIQLFTVPGQIFYDDTRKLVLNGADGVVFVVDSQEKVLDSNIEALENLAINLKKNGYDPEAMPLVLQWNKRDAPTAMPVAELQRILNPNGLPAYPAVATKGEGVFETMKVISRLAVENIRAIHIDGGNNGRGRGYQAPPPTPAPPVTQAPEPTPAIERATSAPPEVPAMKQEPAVPVAVAAEALEALDLGGVDDDMARSIVEGRAQQAPAPSLPVPELAPVVVPPAADMATAIPAAPSPEPVPVVMAPMADLVPAMPSLPAPEPVPMAPAAPVQDILPAPMPLSAFPELPPAVSLASMDALDAALACGHEIDPAPQASADRPEVPEVEESVHAPELASAHSVITVKLPPEDPALAKASESLSEQPVPSSKMAGISGGENSSHWPELVKAHPAQPVVAPVAPMVHPVPAVHAAPVAPPAPKIAAPRPGGAKLPGLAPKISPLGGMKPAVPKMPLPNPIAQRVTIPGASKTRAVVLELPEGFVSQGKTLRLSVTVTEGETVLVNVDENIPAPGKGESVSVPMTVRFRP